MLNDLLKYLGIDPEKAKDLDSFKTEFQSNYYNKKTFEDQKSPEFRELFPKMIGKFAGKNTSKIQSKLKSLGVELKDEEIKDKDFEDILDIGITKLHSELDGKMKTMQADGSKNTDQRVKDLEESLSKLKTKNDDLSEMLKTTKGTLEQKELSFVTEKKNWDLNKNKSDLFKSIKYNDKVKKEPLLQKGFLSEVEETLSFDIDDKGSFVAHEKKTGKLIPNKGKNGEFLSPEEAIVQLGIEKGVIELNPHGGKTGSAQQFSAKGSDLQNSNQLGTFTAPNSGGRVRKVSGLIKEE